MRNKKKCRVHILQQIRLLASIKQKRRQNPHPHRKKQIVEVAKVPRVPRKFRRYKPAYNSNYSKNNQNREDYIQKYLPENLKYITNIEDSPFYLKSIKREKYNSKNGIFIPQNFSVLDEPDECYIILRQLISALFLENITELIFDYEKCKNIELSTQILFDVIVKEFYLFQNECKKNNISIKNRFPTNIKAINIKDRNVQKMLFSVGTPVVLGIQEHTFTDIIKYKLRTHNALIEKDENKRIEQKELDVSEMADYVINCLKKMNKKLTPNKRDDLCTVIGEILINAEEHSTTQHRFSIGYFKEEKDNGNHFGLFRLVILNFGKTIYEKFKSNDCPNKNIVDRMNELSANYTKKSLFRAGEFEEESLWTLYALQEGVTSVSQESYKRGNGSIRFIESFFNIKGSQQTDDISRMSIVSGKTRIVFDGKYCIKEINNTGESFKVMTFNDSGNIEDKPDKDCVIYSKNYFPGTMISAKLLLNDDDIQQISNI